ncbi:YqgE/AlgH family protein [Croceicoccus naphthovorans]|uniref:UPF0301 protein AB433_02970 n=1 Tax=Croceicoccus naphthovorans TaxID=1348774 RepID=A0A0G3XDA6_9SPHN|nr:YqgE/AlgH family protein [Croceicoccus naphthovorans]AKM09167.1 hypothetical protein AB433_02970 [Croceicoccus naphthovorans]MBB3990466.1 putative transcriptional regulator [Croceicoccus naphthovorans]
MSEGEYLKGRILLAMPGMGDPNFDHAVIPIFMHDANGAFGVGVGALREGITLHRILEELDIEPGQAPDCEVHHGGPVEPGRGFVLHGTDYEDDSTMPGGPLGALSSSVAILRAIAEGKGPRQWLIALGYAGWGEGQLDEEMHRHGWYAADGKPELLFETAWHDRWAATWAAEGVDPALLVGQTGTA